MDYWLIDEKHLGNCVLKSCYGFTVVKSLLLFFFAKTLLSHGGWLSSPSRQILPCADVKEERWGYVVEEKNMWECKPQIFKLVS